MTPEAVRVQVLGGFRLSIGSSDPRALDSVRMESLLAYLALHPGPQPRQHLAGLLWPESPEPQARTNLRHLLHTLRAAGVADLLDVTPRTIAWRAAEVDVATFEAALDRATAAGAERITALRDAVDHYPGDLLPSHDDEWVRTERERLRARFCDALEELGTGLRAENPADAVGVLQRLVAVDPLRESAYRQLILAHHARGDRSRAVQTYHRCAAVLERELDVAPSAETRAAYAAALPRHAHTDTPRGDEPPLVGRAAERQALTEAWRMAASDGARLVLLTGEPGIGKTRLAEEFAAWAARHGAATATARAHAAEGAPAARPRRERAGAPAR